MTRPRLTCTCGHVWDYSGDGPVPADVREVCPACVNAFLDEPTPPPPGPPLLDELTPLEQAVDKLISGFEILGEINRGGMGVIYKARQIAMDRIVALKVIAPSRLANPEARRRFKQEVKTAGRLNHQNIVTVYHTDIDCPLPYLAMEYVPGIDLSKLVKTNGPLPIADALHYVLQAAHGLQHAFEVGLIHRDIKPANLMVMPNPLDHAAGRTGKLPRVKILDMGLARVVTEADVYEQRTAEKAAAKADVTRTGVFLGTPDYIAPEQAEDSRKADIRSDIYSLGSSLYFLLTGRAPFPGSTLAQKLRKQLSEPPPSATALREEFSPAADALLRRMMARNPAERPQTPAELIEALDLLIHGPIGGKGSGPHLAVPVGSPGTGLVGTAQVKAHGGGIHSIAVAPDGQFLLTGGLDSAIKVWHATRLKEARAFKGDIGAVEQLAIAPGGKWVASCSLRMTLDEMGVQLWDVATGTERRRLRGPGDNVRCVAISPDGKRVAAGSADHSVWVWSVEGSGPKMVLLTGHTAPVTSLAFTASGDMLLSAGHDAVVRQWDIDEVKELGSLDAEVGPIAALAYAAKAKRLAVAGQSLSVRQRAGKFVRHNGHDGPVNCVAFSADGEVIVTGGADRTVRLWNAADGTELMRFTGHTKPVWSVAFSADGGTVYSGGEGGTLRRWPVSIAPK